MCWVGRRQKPCARSSLMLIYEWVSKGVPSRLIGSRGVRLSPRPSSPWSANRCGGGPSLLWPLLVPDHTADFAANPPAVRSVATGRSPAFLSGEQRNGWQLPLPALRRSARKSSGLNVAHDRDRALSIWRLPLRVPSLMQGLDRCASHLRSYLPSAESQEVIYRLL
jgi:hypothetical protein